MITEDTILSVFRSAILAVLPGFSVVFAKDVRADAPRPNIDPTVDAYAAIEITDDFSTYATAYERTTDTPAPDNKFEQLRGRTIEGTLAIEFYGTSAIDNAHSLRMSYDRADVLLVLNTAGDYVLEQPSSVSDTPVIRSATREPGASITFVVKWPETETYDTEAVDQISTTVSVT